MGISTCIILKLYKSKNNAGVMIIIFMPNFTVENVPYDGPYYVNANGMQAFLPQTINIFVY